MAGREGSGGWNWAKRAVAAWWHRCGWKTIATVAVPLAITFGVIAGWQRVELQDHHLHIDPTGPNWAEILTAGSTCLLAVAAVLALLAIREARRARYAVAITEVARRWDDLSEVRGKVEDYAADGPDALNRRMARLRKDNVSEWYNLLSEPYFFEDLEILIKYRALPFHIVNDSLGSTIRNRWSHWEEFVRQLRTSLNDDRLYENFEKLAGRIAKKR